MSSARAVSLHVPVERAQLGEEIRALGGVLELLERRHVEQAAEAALARVGAPPDEPVDVVGA